MQNDWDEIHGMSAESKPLSARGLPSDANMPQTSARQSGSLKTPKTPKDEKVTERALHALEQCVLAPRQFHAITVQDSE